MAEPQFTPAELDRIEDALESLELADAIEASSPAVRERLVEYRDLLVAARDAMPLQEVPAGILDGVMAEARRSTEGGETLGVAEPAKKNREGFWSRLRRSLLIPGLAVAGAATLVLIIARPTLDSEESAAAEDKLVEAQGGEAVAAKKDARPQRAPAAAPAPAAADKAKEQAEGEEERNGFYEIATSRKRDDNQADDGGVPEAEPEEDASAVAAPVEEAKPAAPAADAPDDQGPRWDVIARGDRARRKGDCKQARPEYQLALADTDSRVQARAYAGLGLCDAWGGDGGKAKENYGRARDLDPEVAMFIEEERPRGSRGSTPNAARSKKKAKKAKSKPAIDPKSAKKKAGDLDRANKMAEPTVGF